MRGGLRESISAVVPAIRAVLIAKICSTDSCVIFVIAKQGKTVSSTYGNKDCRVELSVVIFQLCFSFVWELFLENWKIWEKCVRVSAIQDRERKGWRFKGKVEIGDVWKEKQGRTYKARKNILRNCPFRLIYIMRARNLNWLRISLLNSG